MTAALLAMAGLLSACGHSTHQAAAQPSGLFNNQNQTALSCLVHQRQQPGPLYTGGTAGDTAHILQMMQYYTSYGTKPYCDGAKASTTDRAWARLYVTLGGAANRVTSALGPG